MSPAAYSGTPLPKKLGIQPEIVVLLRNAPQDFAQTLGELPDGVRLRTDRRGRHDLGIWFVRSQSELQAGVTDMAAKLGRLGLWIAWPKLSSPLAGDLREDDVRRAGLAQGLVDFKVCAIDQDWSGLKFQRRRK